MSPEARTPRLSRRVALAVLLAALGAATLLAGSRLRAQSLWIDEAITLVPVTAAGGPADLITRVRRLDTQPPASHLLLYAVRDLLPRDEIGWRLPSLLAAEAGILMLALLAGRLLGPAGLLAAGLCAQVSPYLLFYATEARNYALWFLAVAAAAYAMTRCLEAIAARRPPGAIAGWAAAWALANGLGLWTHLFHLFALLVQGVVLAGLAYALHPPRPVWRRAAVWGTAAFAGALALILPWVLTVVRVLGVARGVGWTRPFASASLGYIPFALVFGFSFGPDLRELHIRPAMTLLATHPLAMGLGALALAALLAGLWSVCRGGTDAIDDVAPVLFLLAPAVGILGPVAYAFALGFPLVPRHLMFLWPLVPMLQAWLWVRRKHFRPAVGAIVALQAFACGALLFAPAYAKDDERGAVRFAEAQSGGRPVILGDAAPLYVARGAGFMKAYTNPGSAVVLNSGATDLWLVDNRPWEDPEGTLRDRTARASERLGMTEAGAYEQFRGLVLRHWRRRGEAR